MDMGAPIVWYPLGTREALKVMLSNLGLCSDDTEPTTPADESVIQAEVLRVGLWALSGHGSELDAQPVYISRLLHAARRLIPLEIRLSEKPIRTDGESDTDTVLQALHRMLDELETIGDVAALPHGRWLPAPLRCVPLPDVARWFLIGGIPTRELALSVRGACEHVGPARLLTRDPAGLGLIIATQSREDWLRAPNEPIGLWARSIMESATLQPFESTDADHEYYAPGNRGSPESRGNLQYHRWMANVQGLPDGRYLIRRKAVFGPVRYALGQIEQGNLGATATLDLGQGDLRRLLYGLDLLADCPVLVRPQPLESGSWEYALANELPGPENRLFLALGRLRPNSDGSYYPRRWEIPASYVTEASNALHRLGIRVEPKQKPR
jgi:hypothetical protein